MSVAGPCDIQSEAAVLASRCGRKLEAWTAMRERVRLRRGLRITWQPSSALWLQHNPWGMGHLLVSLYHLHAMCTRVQRYCYISLYDTEFDRYFTYLNGRRWSVASKELNRYPLPWRTLNFNCTADDAEGAYVEQVLEPAIRADHDSPLIRVNVNGWIPLYKHDAIAGISPVPSVLLRNASSSLARDMLAELLASSTIDPCLARSVTEPASDITAQPRKSAAVHLRTGFADADETLAAHIQHDPKAMQRWLDLACDRSVAGSLGLLDGSARILSDAPALQRLNSNVKVLQTRQTRTWKADSTAKQAAVTDMVMAGLATTLHVAPQRVICNRNVRARVTHAPARCDSPVSRPGPSPSVRLPSPADYEISAKHGGVFACRCPGAALAADQVSSFYRGIGLRSVCLTRITLGLPGCLNFADAFPRDLCNWMRPSADLIRRSLATNSASVMSVHKPKVEARFALLRDRGLSELHPCRHLNASQCYRSFLAALV